MSGDTKCCVTRHVYGLDGSVEQFFYIHNVYNWMFMIILMSSMALDRTTEEYSKLC